MPSGRPWSGARSGRLLFALAAFAFVAGKSVLEGDDAPGNDGAQVELNGAPRSRKAAEIKIDLGDSKDALSARPRKKNVIQIDLGDSKDATVEIVREPGDANVEINGYRVKSRLKGERRYLFGQFDVPVAHADDLDVTQLSDFLQMSIGNLSATNERHSQWSLAHEM